MATKSVETRKLSNGNTRITTEYTSNKTVKEYDKGGHLVSRKDENTSKK